MLNRMSNQDSVAGTCKPDKLDLVTHVTVCYASELPLLLNYALITVAIFYYQCLTFQTSVREIYAATRPHRRQRFLAGTPSQ